MTVAFGLAMGLSFFPPNSNPLLPEKQARLSYYWPALGGTNCHSANWNKETNTCSALLYGKQWQEWAGKGAACPMQYKLGTRLWIARLNKEVICVDRGGAIKVLPDGSYFIDLLQEEGIWVQDWKVGVIKDRWCPSGCYLSEVSLIRVLKHP